MSPGSGLLVIMAGSSLLFIMAGVDRLTDRFTIASVWLGRTSIPERHVPVIVFTVCPYMYKVPV